MALTRRRRAYTLPTSGTVTGTYQWDATYSGDTNNNAASENSGTGRADGRQPGQPRDHDDAEHHRADAGHVVGDVE